MSVDQKESLRRLRLIVKSLAGRTMVELDSKVAQIREAMAVVELRGTIDYALRRCLTVAEIVDHLLDQEGLIDSTYVDRLSEIELCDRDQQLLAQAVQRLAMLGENASSKVKAKIDRTILRILRLLSPTVSAPFASKYFAHRLKGRRRWAYSTFRDMPLSADLCKTLVAVYRQYRDQEALQLIARNPAQTFACDHGFLLKHLHERYWRARVMQAVLLHDQAAGIQLGADYPVEFAHAVGRTGDHRLLDALCALLPTNSRDLEFLSVYAYALGKLKASDRLNDLRAHVDRTFGPPGAERSGR